MNYLGVDFGTANCAAFGHRDGQLIPIPLDGESFFLSSVVHASRLSRTSFQVDEEDFQSRLGQAIREERIRFERDERELRSRLEIFESVNGPKLPLPPRRAIFKSEEEYNLAAVQYEEERRLHLQALEQFREGPLAEEIVTQRRFLRPLMSRDEIVRLVRGVMIRELAEKAEADYWDQSFFSVIRSKDADIVFGSEASDRFSRDPSGGFFLRSPKAFLGAEGLKTEVREFFVDVISRMLAMVKRKSEQYAGCSFDGIVIGRPVNYLGSSNQVSNDAAIQAMRDAAVKAGFISVRFVYEPMAAALTVTRNQLEAYREFLLVDIGGGTTDCVMMRVAPGGMLDVVKYSGSRVGGNDFDETIAWNSFMPLFGKDSVLKSGLPVPYSVLHDAISTRDVNAQSRFKKSHFQILNLVAEANQPNLIRRLLALQEGELQHRLLLDAEEVKVNLSSVERCKVNLDYIEDALQVDVARGDLTHVVQRHLARIAQLAMECLDDERRSRGILTLVTGGLSCSRDVMLALRDSLPSGSRLANLPALGAVAQGIGLVAMSLSRHESISAETDSVRGIPIFS